MQDKLKEIVWLRAIATLCIIIGHCFLMYDNYNLSINEYISPIYGKIYKGVNPFLIYLALPLFVFISGYLLAHNKKIGKEKEFKTFLSKKIMRLWIPGLIFSLLYYILFKFNFSDNIILIIINLLVNGYGHLWFLYMLFGVYIIGWIHLKYLKSHSILLNTILVLIPLFIFIFCNFPRGMGQVMFYYFFFYLGIITYWNKNWLKKITSDIKSYLFIVIYIISFIFFSYIKLFVFPKINNESIILLSHWSYRFSLGFIGILTIYLFSIQRNNYNSVLIVSISSKSFIMYIIHQFILISLLMSNFSINLVEFSQAFFPFILSIIVILLTYILSFILYKNKYVQKYL